MWVSSTIWQRCGAGTIQIFENDISVVRRRKRYAVLKNSLAQMSVTVTVTSARLASSITNL